MDGDERIHFEIPPCEIIPPIEMEASYHGRQSHLEVEWVPNLRGRMLEEVE